ncbi:class I SAM-dependent methyltransferase [Paenibacillus sp. FSL L8-0709]|uniref:class I SAM-dependent methyltransferase n=1 Tax=Paenibacillus sp. FSL L8-0709 TaxID=2975312 RepID=UPI0030F6899F
MDWYKKSFLEDYLIVYNHRDRKEAGLLIESVIDWLKLPLGSDVLDLCCGAGRHSLALADAGYHVTGVDLSPILLQEAKKADYKNRIRWIESDMRSLPKDGTFRESFDAIVNLFTSFGYFETDDEQLKVLKQISRGLRLGGRFVIDILNSHYVYENLIPFSQRKEKAVIISESRVIQNDFVIKEIMLEEPGNQPRRYTERVKLYSLVDIESLLKKADLTIDEVYGDYNGKIYNELQSSRMIVVGHRNKLL